MRWPERVLELRVGDTVEIGELRVTVVDIDDREVCFRIENESGSEWEDEVPLSDLHDLPR